MEYQKYIGIPYSKANCADLALMIQKNEFGKEYIDYEKPESTSPFGYCRAVKKNIPNYLEERLIPINGCAVLLVCRGRLSHIGTYLNMNKTDYVIHTSERFKSSIMTPLHDLKKFGIEIQGFYSWK